MEHTKADFVRLAEIEKLLQRPSDLSNLPYDCPARAAQKIRARTATTRDYLTVFGSPAERVESSADYLLQTLAEKPQTHSKI